MICLNSPFNRLLFRYNGVGQNKRVRSLNYYIQSPLWNIVWYVVSESNPYAPIHYCLLSRYIPSVDFIFPYVLMSERLYSFCFFIFLISCLSDAYNISIFFSCCTFISTIFFSNDFSCSEKGGVSSSIMRPLSSINVVASEIILSRFLVVIDWFKTFSILFVTS